MSIIGDNLKSIRTARGLYQHQLGNMIGKNQRTISSWEKGGRIPSSEEVRKLAKALRVSPAEIIGHLDIADNEFEFIVSNDDMSPEIKTGDTLTVNSSMQPQDGDLVIIENNKKQQLVRRLYQYGKMLSLIAINTSIKPINVDKDSITIKGKVTELKRKV